MQTKTPDMNCAEYTQMKYFAAAVSEIIIACEQFENRLKLVPNAWRNARLAAAMSRTALEALLETVPAKKRVQLQSELGQMDIKVIHKGAVPYNDDEHKTLTIKYNDVWEIVSKAQGVECEFCQKDAKRVRRCKLRKLIENILPYSVNTITESGECAFNIYGIDNPFTVQMEEDD